MDAVSGGAPFGLGAPADCGAWLRLSKRASTCGCNLGHFKLAYETHRFVEGGLGLKFCKPFLVALAGVVSDGEATSVASESVTGGAVSPADGVLSAGAFRLAASHDPAALCRLSKIAGSCGFSPGHLSLLSKRIASSMEGFALSSASRSSSCLQASSTAADVGPGAAVAGVTLPPVLA